ncbi:MAG TPA: ribosome biogenesis GTP-binding protein YihA/YsxC [Nevskiaceae bacterium]|nr:ribosome biogenesis GTP-binding protein YihA/YsxC [Nevskiaceae bacterium]
MNNPLATARFTISCARLEQLPSAATPEVAFAGRSNAGKSSALNALTGQSQLARVSKTPGRTQLINCFDVGERGRLVDLPGYGYAKVPEPIRRSWGDLVGGYLDVRENLRGLIVLMDIRHPLTDLDRQLLDWARHRDRACHVLLTKADKLGFGAAKSTLQKVNNEIGKLQMQISAQLFSSTSKLGVEEAREKVMSWLSA